MGFDSDANFDPKLGVFRQVPIIYTQLSVVSTFSHFVGSVSVELRFALGSFTILPLTLWDLVWIRQVGKEL